MSRAGECLGVLGVRLTFPSDLQYLHTHSYAEIKISFDSSRNNETVNRSDQIYAGPSNNPHIGHAGLCPTTTACLNVDVSDTASSRPLVRRHQESRSNWSNIKTMKIPPAPAGGSWWATAGISSWVTSIKTMIAR